MRLIGGASCCTARALPQSGRLTIAVTIAVMDGRLNPAAIPITSMASLIMAREVIVTHTRRAIETQKIESISVPLWFILEETKPEKIAPNIKPRELIRNIEPACPALIPRSAEMVGSSGEKIKRLMNVRKNISVRYRMLQNMD